MSEKRTAFVFNILDEKQKFLPTEVLQHFGMPP